MKKCYLEALLPELGREFLARVGESPPTLETDFVCGCSDGAIVIEDAPPDKLQQKLSDAVAILAIRKRRRIAAAYQIGTSGAQLYYLENWPLTLSLKDDGSAVKLSERGNACWLDDKDVEQMRRKPT